MNFDLWSCSLLLILLMTRLKTSSRCSSNAIGHCQASVAAGVTIGLTLAKEAVVCGPWAWACVLGAAVVTAGLYVAGDILARDCRAACEKTHAAGGGGHGAAGTGGHTHLR